jgi:hypothetical protein
MGCQLGWNGFCDVYSLAIGWFIMVLRCYGVDASGSYYVHPSNSFLFLMLCSLCLSLVMCLPLAGGIITLNFFLRGGTIKLCARHIAKLLLRKWFN